MGPTPKWLVYTGKSHLEMDDDWGYPYFRKPPYLLQKRPLAQQFVSGVILQVVH